MSKYSGKCDFYDHIQSCGLEGVLASNIYVGRNIICLKIESEKDLIPYYPFLVLLDAYDSETGKRTIKLDTESFVDKEEKEWLERDLKLLFKYYNYCKRKHIPFNKTTALHKIWSFLDNIPEYMNKLVDRVELVGKKATIDNLHSSYHDYYREILYRDMVDAGYSKFIAYYWVYDKYDFDLLKENN